MWWHSSDRNDAERSADSGYSHTGTMTTSTPVPANRSASSTPVVEHVHPAADEKMADGTESLPAAGAIDAAAGAGDVTAGAGDVAGRAESHHNPPSVESKTGTEAAAPTAATPTPTLLRRSPRAKTSPRSALPAASILPHESDQRSTSSAEVRARYVAVPASMQVSKRKRSIKFCDISWLTWVFRSAGFGFQRDFRYYRKSSGLCRVHRDSAQAAEKGQACTNSRALSHSTPVELPTDPIVSVLLEQLLPAPTSPRIFSKAPSSITPSALIRHVFPHINLPSLDKPFDLTDISADKRAFTREELRTNPQATINRGSVGTTYFRTRRFIALKPELNICDPGPTALGEPLVVVTNDAVCRKFFEAVECGRERGSGPHPVPPINVFIKNATKKWVYRGAYELAYDGSGERALRLFPGAGATANVHESIRRAVEARIDDGPEIRNKQAMLRSWGWKLPTYSTDRKEESKVDLWTELEVTDIKPRISFLVLRCVGFSEEDYRVWKGLRQEVGVYRDPDEKR